MKSLKLEFKDERPDFQARILADNSEDL